MSARVLKAATSHEHREVIVESGAARATIGKFDQAGTAMFFGLRGGGDIPAASRLADRGW